MSFADCIDRHLADKKIGGENAKLAKKRYENIFNELRSKGHADGEAERLAASMATEHIERELLELQKRNLARWRAEKVIQADIASYQGENLAEAAKAFISRRPGAPFMGYEGMQQRVRKQLGQFLNKAIAKYDVKFAGTHAPKAGLDNVVHELFGRGTGDRSAKEIAAGFTEMSEHAIRVFRLAGGSVDDLAGWHIPQRQSRALMHKHGEDEWARDWLQWNDWEKTRRPDGTLIPEAQRLGALKAAYWALRTDGASKIDVDTGRPGHKALGNQLEANRFLHPKSSEAWLAMHKKYSEGSVYNVMIEHMELMAHRIAMVQRFGPNPTEMRKFIVENVKAEAAKRQRALPAKDLVHKAEKELEKFDTMFAIAARENLMVDGSILGDAAATVRHITMGALLGSVSLISAKGDAATMRATKAFNGMTDTRFLKTFFQLFFNNQELARQAHVLVEDGIAQNYARTRYGVTESMNAAGNAWTRRAADIVLRGSLLVPLTRAMRQTFQAEWLGWMAREAGKTFDETDMRAAFQRYGITAEEWDIMRTVPLFEYRDGTKFLRPDDLTASPEAMGAVTRLVQRELGIDELPNTLTIERRAHNLADKFMVQMIEESRYAVLDSTIEATATLRGKSRSGTLAGELANSFALLKNFPATMYFTHLRRGMLEHAGPGRLGYIASVFIMMTLAGAGSIQLRNLRDGKDPESMITPTFWLRAATAGGGLAIWGDFLLQTLARTGGTMTETFAGAPVAMAGKFVASMAGNVRKAFAGEETSFAADANTLVRYMHPGSNLWYTKLLTQNLIWDNIQRMVDPKAHSKWRSKQTKARNLGQSYWWNPGALAPSRMPNSP